MTNLKIPPSELQFTFSRSSGSGGQNVNKVSTKVTLHWNLLTSSISNHDRQILLSAPEIQQRLNNKCEVVITEQATRSQDANKIAAEERLLDIINRALIPPKKRRKTKPSRGSKERRLQTKKQHSKKKESRRYSE